MTPTYRTAASKNDNQEEHTDRTRILTVLQAFLILLLCKIFRTNKQYNRPRSESSSQQSPKSRNPNQQGSDSSETLTTDSDDTIIIETIVEDFDPSIEYKMSGAVHPKDDVVNHTLCGLAAVCPDYGLSFLTHWMPLKILDKTDLLSLVAFSDESIASQIPDEALTTFSGIARILEELHMNNHTYDPDAVLDAIAGRVGRVMDCKRVVYPEDMVPYVSPDDERYDPEYWQYIRGQGRFWHQYGI